MENWGLITYRETALLYDPIMSSTGNKERVVTVIAHELAHMVGNKSGSPSFSQLFFGENSRFLPSGGDINKGRLSLPPSPDD